jgi:Domain of unknown function (DUF6265)
MRRLLLPLALLVAAPLGAQTTSGTLPEWMAGTWAMENGADWADEIWSDQRGGLMLGMGRAGFGTELRSWETLQIRRNSDGTVSYLAQPQGQPAVEFRMVLVSETAIEFANPAHDFPQRIRYWRQGKLLLAEISKLDGSDARQFSYRPVVPPGDE